MGDVVHITVVLPTVCSHHEILACNALTQFQLLLADINHMTDFTVGLKHEKQAPSLKFLMVQHEFMQQQTDSHRHRVNYTQYHTVTALLHNSTTT